MKFTFGITTAGNNENIINQMIDSIEKQNIENYEIIIVGSCNINRHNTAIISFDETIKSNWITRKKNIISNNSKYDNIVFMHDYIVLENDWYDGYLKFGNDFKLCMNKIVNIDGSRFRDWHLGWGDGNRLGVYNGLNYLLPYNETRFSKFMYFSGSYWVAKKQVMLEFPLNEQLVWNNAEDIEWSNRVREHYDFSINSNSTVKLLKYKDPVFFNITNSELDLLIKNYNTLYNK